MIDERGLWQDHSSSQLTGEGDETIFVSNRIIAFFSVVVNITVVLVKVCVYYVGIGNGAQLMKIAFKQ